MRSGSHGPGHDPPWGRNQQSVRGHDAGRITAAFHTATFAAAAGCAGHQPRRDGGRGDHPRPVRRLGHRLRPVGHPLPGLHRRHPVRRPALGLAQPGRGAGDIARIAWRRPDRSGGARRRGPLRAFRSGHRGGRRRPARDRPAAGRGPGRPRPQRGAAADGPERRRRRALGLGRRERRRLLVAGALSQPRPADQHPGRRAQAAGRGPSRRPRTGAPEQHRRDPQRSDGPLRVPHRAAGRRDPLAALARRGAGQRRRARRPRRGRQHRHHRPPARL